jgi:hypothetical protein
MRFPLRLKLPLILAALVVGATFIVAAPHYVRDATVPVVFEVSPASPGPNTQVSFTVVLDGPSSSGQVVSIGCTDAQAFLDLPTEVIIPAGSASTTFHATTSNLFTSWSIIAATSNGGTALAVPQ